MSEYTRISFEEREKIYLLDKRGLNITSIAKELGRHKSNISRELKRCKDDPLGYIPDRAHAMYRAGLSRKINNQTLINALEHAAMPNRGISHSVFDTKGVIGNGSIHGPAGLPRANTTSRRTGYDGGH